MLWVTHGNVTRGEGRAGVVWYITQLRPTSGELAGQTLWSLHAKGAGGGYMNAGLYRTFDGAKRMAEDEDV